MASIKVCVRMRPLLPHDPSDDIDTSRITLKKQNDQVIVSLTDTKEKHFKFNSVFSEDTTQSSVYEGVEAPTLVNRVLQGYHSTIFAYGQTGSGKTYTIQGGIDSQEGLIPRMISDLFAGIKKYTERTYKIFLSHIQVYNQNIYDLIDLNERPLKMRWNKHQQFVVQNIFQGLCRDEEEALTWWRRGHKNKIMGSHKMNNTSSRSHCVLTIKAQSYNIEDPSDMIESKLQIIDLAGSERQKVTKSTGIVFKEGIQINKSLFTLRQVISSLYESTVKKTQKTMPPYRDSKLTSLLKQSIGGNSYCVMIACLNPQTKHFEESIQTLTYASMATFISNAPIKNIDPKIIQNTQLKQQNHQLKIQLNKMAQHIQYLTKLFQNHQCLQCAKNNFSQRKNHSQEKHSKEENNQPSGIKNFAKNKISQNQDKHTSGTFLKSSKDIIQSITMIKQLIGANSSLRNKVESLKQYISVQQKQTFALMQENQVLRNRWDMLNGTIAPQNEERNNINQSTLQTFERMVRESKGKFKLDPKPVKISSFISGKPIQSRRENNQSITQQQKNSSFKLNYNDLLKNGKKKETLGRRRLHSQTKKTYLS